jgi:hypothetical protein
MPQKTQLRRIGLAHEEQTGFAVPGYQLTVEIRNVSGEVPTGTCGRCSGEMTQEVLEEARHTCQGTFSRVLSSFLQGPVVEPSNHCIEGGIPSFDASESGFYKLG